MFAESMFFPYSSPVCGVLACVENVLITEEHKLICTVFHMCVLSLDGLISHKLAPEATFSPLSFAASLRLNVRTR